jgi:hypothetical protein
MYKDLKPYTQAGIFCLNLFDLNAHIVKSRKTYESKLLYDLNTQIVYNSRNWFITLTPDPVCGCLRCLEVYLHEGDVRKFTVLETGPELGVQSEKRQLLKCYIKWLLTSVLPIYCRSLFENVHSIHSRYSILSISFSFESFNVETFENTRVARFFLVQHTKTGKIYQITIKYNKWPQ